MSTLEKYLIRRTAPASDHQPERMTEEAALKILVSATGGAACPVHEVGPVANHVRGPVAAIPPEGHPDWLDLRGHTSQRSQRAVDLLIADACGLLGSGSLPCRCDGDSKHPLAVIMRHLSQGLIIRAHLGDTETQTRMQEAVHSGDVDRQIHVMEPRLDALKMLVDRARAEHGGTLPEVVTDAAVLLARTLVGPSRWDVRNGYSMYDWPTGWRANTVNFEKANWYMTLDDTHNRVIARLIEGA